MTNFKRIYLLISILALAFALGGCNKSDDEGSGTNNKAGDDQIHSITYNADKPGGKGEVRLALLDADPAKAQVRFNLIGDGIEHVYGVAGKLNVDPTLAIPEMVIGGEHFIEGAALIAPNETGATFGITKKGDPEGYVDLMADKPIGILVFHIDKTGKSRIDFDPEASYCVGPDLDILQDVHWVGGELLVE